jgi:hypothetical protein
MFIVPHSAGTLKFRITSAAFSVYREAVLFIVPRQAGTFEYGVMNSPLNPPRGQKERELRS